jgi:hypothetical protein
MDGYSVNEAAAVLGIPEGRVWELLARGVLSGATEVGGDMRVFLRGTALTEAAPTPKPNGESNGGNGGSHGEMSAFRELLTEFRNLTERYGQALLALGEARGEVASLRGRVDLLEARLENRVPWTAPAPAAWAPAPAPEVQPEPEPEPVALEPEADVVEPEAVVELDVSEVDVSEVDISEVAASDAVAELEEEPVLDAVAEVEEEPVLDAEPEVEPIFDTAAPDLPELPDEPFEEALADDASVEATSGEAESIPEMPEEASGDSEPAAHESHRSTGHSQARAQARAAVAGFAEALARAEDPTTAEVGSGDEPLPGSDELADAVAAYRDDVETDAETRSPPQAQIEEDEEPPVAQEPIEEVPMAISRPGYSTATPEPDWIAEEDLIVAAGEPSDSADDWSREGLVVDEPVSADPEPAPVAAAVEAPVELAPEETEDGPAEVAGDVAGAEIAAAFDPWPVREEEVVADEVAEEEEVLEELAAEIEEPEPIDELEAIPAMAPEEAAIEQAAEVTEPVAYAGIPIEPDTEDDAWGLGAVSLVPAGVESATTESSGLAAAPAEAVAEPDLAPWPVADVEPATVEPAPWGRFRVEIAAEPPAEDDAALLEAPQPDPVAEFAEPPILPQEPAFWEPGARERAPFAIPHADPWEAAETETAAVEIAPSAGEPAPASPPLAPAVPPPPSAGPAPSASRPSPSSPRPSAARRKRGPAARAIRRLRYLID